MGIFEEEKKSKSKDIVIERRLIKTAYHKGNKIFFEGRQVEVVNVITTGGMGNIYIAVDHEWNVQFAIKVLKEKYHQNRALVNSFIKEAKIWIKLGTHENIVKALFVKKIDEKPYVFSEYVDGMNLREHFSFKRKIDISQSLDFAIQFCNGMDYGYNKMRIVHRDIKPENILITRDGILKITDFGLAKAFDVTEEKIDFMTPEYASPEQFLDSTMCDTRSDIYSFGVMFYEMLTGNLPFNVVYTSQRERFAKFREKHLNAIPIKTSEINLKIPREIGFLVMKCLEKKPKDRYQSFRELKEELMKIYKDITGKLYKLPETNITKKIKDIIVEDLGLEGVSLDELDEHEEEVLERYNKALRIDPNNADTWYNEGALLLNKSKKYKEAIICFNNALRIIPNHVDAWYNKGVAHWHLSEYEEATRCYQNLIRINPHDAEAYINMGNAFRSLNKYEEAVKCFKEAISINENFAEAWLNLALSFIDWDYEGYKEEIKLFLANALRINPNLYEEIKNAIK